MFERFFGLVGRIDRYVGPIYRMLFVATAVIAGVTWLVYEALPLATQAYNWIDGRIADIGPLVITPQGTTRLLISLSAGLIGGLISIFAEYRRVQELRLKITDEIRRCTASHIKYYDELFTLITSQEKVSSDLKMQMISEISRSHSIFLCSRLAEIFEKVTRAPCHASIKSFNSSSGSVTTRTRDALMHNHDRSTADDFKRSYPFVENTAFNTILTDQSVDIYINNFLRFSDLMGRYKNGNPEWRNNYHATVVAPITESRSAATITRDTVIGFVCVDNKRGRFPRRYSKAVLSVFVLLINDMMVKLGEIEAA